MKEQKENHADCDSHLLYCCGCGVIFVIKNDACTNIIENGVAFGIGVAGGMVFVNICGSETSDKAKTKSQGGTK